MKYKIDLDNINMISYDETKFLFRLKQYGVKRLLESCDFILGVLFTLLLIVIILLMHIPSPILQKFPDVFLSIAAALFGIIVGGFAIVVSIMDKEYVVLLKKAVLSSKTNAFLNIMFLFWYVAGLSVLAIAFAILLNFFTFPSWIWYVVFSFSAFFFFYALFATLSLMGTIMRYGIYRSDLFDERTKDN